MQNAKSFLENLHFAILILHFLIPLQRNGLDHNSAKCWQR